MTTNSSGVRDWTSVCRYELTPRRASADMDVPGLLERVVRQGAAERRQRSLLTIETRNREIGRDEFLLQRRPPNGQARLPVVHAPAQSRKLIREPRPCIWNKPAGL